MYRNKEQVNQHQTMRYHTLAHIVTMSLLLGLVACNPTRNDTPTVDHRNDSAPVAVQDHSNPNPSPVAPGTKLEREPQPVESAAPSQSGRPLTFGGGPLREGQVRTLHLGPGIVTNVKLAITTVTVTVTSAASTGSSAADPTLVGGTIIGAGWGGGTLDKPINSIVLNGDGSVTVTLNAAATATSQIKVVVARQFGA